MRPKVFTRTLSAYLRSKLRRYVPARRYKQIFEEIEKIKPVNIMEVGTWNGERAKQMIEFASKFHPVSEISYFGYDLFESMNKDVYAEEISKVPPTEKDVFAKLSNTGAQIKLFKGYTSDTMRTIETLPKMDFVFIDGGHNEDTVRNDWNGVQKVMDDRTVVIFDDYWHNRTDGPKVVIDKIDRDEFNVKFLPEIDVFFNPDFGKLVISLVKVTLNH